MLSTIYLVATLGALYSVLKHLSVMDGPTTHWSVRYQHVALFAGLLFSLTLPGDAGFVALPISVFLFFCFSAPRWDHGAPWEKSG